MKEKFYIIAERHNPQLGTYLSGAYIAAKRVNKCSITATYDYYGTKRKMKFDLYKNPSNGVHIGISDSECAYGSMAYYGFDTLDKALIYLKTCWPNHYNLDRCLKALQAA